MKQDFLSQEEVEQLLKGVSYDDAPPKRFYEKTELKIGGADYVTIEANDDVENYIFENWREGIDFCKYGHHVIVNHEILTMLNLKFK